MIPDPVRHGKPPEGPVNILLVDDQPARLLSYQAVLEPLGQTLVLAKSGNEALQRLMEREYALILLDISMPGMDGFETAAMIHAHPRFERTPIIFVTGVHDTEFDRIKGYELGAVDYVSIPVVPEILRSKVAVLVELHCQRRELQLLNTSLAEANRQLAAANTTLQVEKTRELQQLNATLHAANRELEHSNLALQRQVAERLRAEAALKVADQRKNEFLAILAHELRNPLAALASAAHLLARPAQEPAVATMAREALHRQVNHMARLLDDLLDVARITHGIVKLQMERVSLHEVITAVADTVRPQMEQKQQELVLELCPEPAFVNGDEVRLSQVVGNLLSNAVKYTPAAGRIGLRMAVERNQVIITVRDNGIGISPDMLGLVFEMFSQVNRSAQGPRGGLGIGLALVKGLIGLHGGTITATSEGEGQGSEFTIVLPALSIAADAPARLPQDAPQPSRAFRILVADDNVDSANSWSELLKQNGHEVRTAYDGLAALNAAGVFMPEVAILDIGMPGMDGYGVAKRIREAAWGADMLLIAITGWGQAHDREQSRAAGFDHHFTKPVDPARIEQALAKGAGIRDRAAR